MKNPLGPRRHRAGWRGQAAVSAAALVALAVPVSLTGPAALAAPARTAGAGGTAGGPGGSRTAVQVWTTTTSSADTLALQLAREPDVTFGPQPSQSPQITVDPHATFQTIEGFGGAMTDTTAYLIDHSPERAQIMTDLFGRSGANFGFVRLPMGASDLSLSNYSYDDMPPGQADPTLAHFSVSHDTAYIIPVLRDALSLDPGIKIDATPWSAPAWMKNGDTFVGDCSGTGNYLNPAYYPAYAKYFAKFVSAYSGSYGIPIYMVSMQNEPQNCSAGYATMNLDATGPNPSEAAFAPYLRSALDSAGHSDVKILGYDHNWYGPDGNPTTYPQDLMAAAGTDVNAIGYHCYSTPGGVNDPFDVQGTFHDAYPGTPVYFTECAGGSWAPDAAGNLDWEALNNIIGPMSNWAVASDYWTMATDPNSGPNVATASGGCGTCRGMVTIDNSNGTFTLNEDYYVWAQFSKFVQPGAVRIGSSNLESSGLPDIAFRNPDGSIALVVLNDNPSAQTFGVNSGGQGFSYPLPANSIVTFTWSPPGRPASSPATAAPLGASCGAPVSGTALNRHGWTASTSTATAGGDSAARAIDGNTSTQFSSDAPQADGMYWQADMGSAKTFDELRMQAPASPGDYAVSYDLEVSGNGRSWTTVAICAGTGDPETVSFPPQTARYVKVVDTTVTDGLATATASPWSIGELNLYRGGAG
ncbi:MAG TPA: glycoside hydrolase family 30 beta sandwich domain-containing protein [Trebonia sp.]|nr:glycoside hydrolase family 30 beta sandwich domain-containing protein [Trebonia sp.]